MGRSWWPPTLAIKSRLSLVPAEMLVESHHWRPRYQRYFNQVQALWASTPDDTRTALIATMTEAVEIAGANINPEFPMLNKIIELRLIGRQHPVG